MNITNAEYFTFNVDNSMLLVGMTASGKSYLMNRLIEDLVESHTSDELQFVLLDMTRVDFSYLRKEKPDYIQAYENNPEKAFEILEEMVALSEARAKQQNAQPLLFICIEECNMAALDQARFDKLVTAINSRAKAANMKLIYSTSSPRITVVSRELQKSFDLTIAGKMSSSADYELLGVPVPTPHNMYDFVVVQQYEN